jgi:replication factor C subunit 1
LGSRLEDGRSVEEGSKYRKYLDLKQKGKKWPELLTEDQFLALLPNAPKPATKPAAVVATSTTPGSASHVVSKGPGLSNWVDTHAPKDFGDLIGNANVVRKLSEWLRDWDSVVLKGNTKKVAFKPGGGVPENVNARAVLLSGPPGIGKTTTARLVAQLHGGYEILEYNASDARGQKIIQEMASGIADNTTISFGGAQKKVPVLTRRAILIMDEVDGMGAGDRGGNAALIKMIKKTKNPIICICNDAHSQKVRSLAFSCYDLKFARPTKSTIAQRCAHIAQKEGLNIEPNALEALAESCGGDMRMVLNQLQIVAGTPVYKSAGVKYMDMKEKITEMEKDQQVMMTPFDACKKLLNSSEGSRMSFRQRMDLFFIDHSLVGLLVQENYVNAVKNRNDLEVLHRCAYSADLLTIGDILSTRIQQTQEWNLLPDVAVLGAVYPAHVTNGFISFPSFPAYLGKYSTMSRSRRLTTELLAHTRLASTVRGKSVLTSNFGDLLYKRMLKPLMTGDPEAVQETVAVLDAYGLRKEHLTEHLTELRQHLGLEDLFKVVEPRVKAAMTREFNSGAHGNKVALPSRKRKAGGANAEDVNPDELGDDDFNEKEAEEPAEEGSDDDTGGAFIKVKGKPKSKGKAKAKADSSSQDTQVAPKAKARGRAKAKA